ncbi:hypothetical protein EJB05_39774, partial [Eragrostis curvula]
MSDDQLEPAKPLVFPNKLISNNGFFALGLFSPANSSSTRFYLGIWYNNLPERMVVWVANRDNPITTRSSSTLAVTNRSELVLSDPEGRVYWSTKSSVTTTGGAGASAALLNDGNLVLRFSEGDVLWQSFDHPTDTLLPGMPFRVNYRTRATERLVSWKGPEDPSTGDFSVAGDVTSGIQFFIWHGSNISWRHAPFNGATVSSYQPTGASYVIVKSVVVNGDEISLTYSVSDGSLGVHTRVAYTGRFEFRIWNSTASAWTVVDGHPGPGCDGYASCGPFGYCDFTEAVTTCKCPDGFQPNGAAPSGGCARKETLRCGDGDHFATMPHVKIPAMPVFVRNRSSDGCAAECLGNCSCTAYAYTNLSNAMSGGDPSRCLLWFGELVDMGKYPINAGEDLYLRLAGSTVALHLHAPFFTPRRPKLNMGKACVPVFILLILSSTSHSDDQLTQGKPLSPGDELISEGGDFVLGFFSPTNNSSTRLYIGIWYHNLPERERTVVWVANRDSPITTPSSAQLTITNSSELVLSDGKGRTLWTSAVNNATAGGVGAVAVLLSSGNFVLRSSNGTDIWQSFDHPTDTILPTMKILPRYKAQTATHIFAWKGPDDPSTGDISGGVDPDSDLQFFIWNGTAPYCRTTVFNDASLSSLAYYQSNVTSIFYQAMVTGD